MSRMRALISSPPSRRGKPSEKRPSATIEDRAGRTDDVLDVGVAVLDDDRAVGRAPDDVEGAHALAAERPFDARPPEAVGHHAVEAAVAADRNRVGAAAERRHQAGEQAIALLPVGARDVERNARLLAVRGASLELDVGLGRGDRRSGPMSIHSGPNAYCSVPPMGTGSSGSVIAERPRRVSACRLRPRCARRRSAASSARRRPAHRRAPRPRRAGRAKRPDGHSSRLRPEARPGEADSLRAP